MTEPPCARGSTWAARNPGAAPQPRAVRFRHRIRRQFRCRVQDRVRQGGGVGKETSRQESGVLPGKCGPLPRASMVHHLGGHQIGLRRLRECHHRRRNRQVDRITPLSPLAAANARNEQAQVSARVVHERRSSSARFTTACILKSWHNFRQSSSRSVARSASAEIPHRT